MFCYVGQKSCLVYRKAMYCCRGHIDAGMRVDLNIHPFTEGLPHTFVDAQKRITIELSMKLNLYGSTEDNTSFMNDPLPTL